MIPWPSAERSPATKGVGTSLAMMLARSEKSRWFFSFVFFFEKRMYPLRWD